MNFKIDEKIKQEFQRMCGKRFLKMGPILEDLVKKWIEAEKEKSLKK